MKGLLIKEFLLFKKHGIYSIAVSLLFFIIAMVSPNNANFIYYSVCMLSVIPISLYAYDEQCKWEIYERILPVTKKQAVGAKYIEVFIITVPAALIYSLLLCLRNGADAGYFALNAAISLVAGLAVPCISMPIIFRFGYLLGRFINVIVVIIIAFFATAIILLGNLEAKLSPALLFAAGAALYAVSFLISVKAYEAKKL